MPTRVAIIEDDKDLADDLKELINGVPGFTCSVVAHSAERAVQVVPGFSPDMILMDVNLPKASGVECALKLRKKIPDAQIIMLTVVEDDDVLFEALQAGAVAYLVKGLAPVQLLEAMEIVKKGGSPMSNVIARKLVNYFHKANSSRETVHLTVREIQILNLLVKGLKPKEIADEMSVSFFTIRAHFRNIYDKLHVRSQAEVVAKYLAMR